MDNSNKLIVVFMLFLCVFMTVSCVCASEINDINTTACADNINSNMVDSVVFPGNGDVIDDYDYPIGTFDELNKDFEKLQPNDHYILKKDFVFNKTDKSNPVIKITSDYVTIHGNNHVIDACGCDLAKFLVTGNHVTLYGVHFTNFCQSNNESVICNINDENYAGSIHWTGDNGHIDDCTFDNNIAPNGGALTWSGNNGKIEYCLFENNTALNRGGALYITGENNYIVATTFITFKSSFANEAVYYAKNQKKTSANTLHISDSYYDNAEVTDNLVKVLWDDGCKVIYNSIDLSYANFNELCSDLENLKSGDYYNIEKDYTIFNPQGELAKNRVIKISADNVIINGNGHVLDGRGANDYFALFNITGNNVVIFNLVIFNFRAYGEDYVNSKINIDYNSLTSPIEWHGNDGYIYNCTFIENCGVNGGAVNWYGNNGMVEDCIFKTNAACFGGSIYISGNNNKIRNCKFIDSYTSNHFEAIYFTNSQIINPKLTLSNCYFESKMLSAKDIDKENGCKLIYEGFKPKNTFHGGHVEKLRDVLINLKDGDVFDMDRDYYLDLPFDSIDIHANNITINGNGYTIYGDNPACTLFNIYGQNIKISDLTLNFTIKGIGTGSLFVWKGDNGVLMNCIISGSDAANGGAICWCGNNGSVFDCSFNGCSADIGGAICWCGNNGSVFDCSFNGCSADIGGAISWSGNKGFVHASTFDKNTARNGGAVRWVSNDGAISDCIFINNGAQSIGGAIYIGGSNNIITNSIFINCSSGLSGEAIYLNRNRINISLKNNAYKDNMLYVDGAKTNIDVDAVLDFSHYSQVADENVNLVPLIYTILTKDGLSYLDNGVMYYGEHNKGVFTLHVTKYFGEISFTKNYKFKGITDYNSIFYDLMKLNYETSITLVYSITITSNTRINDDYTDAITSSPMCFTTLGEYLTKIPESCRDASLILNKVYNALNPKYDNKYVSLGLNINFGGAYTIRGAYVLQMDNLGFDVIHIEGNGTKIYITSADSDENKWAIVGANKVLSVSNLIIEGYNTAIENLNPNGYCVLDKVTLSNNRMDYWFDRDYGAAIRSTGYVECKNCLFSNNYAKYGGAVYNQGLICFYDCKFNNNQAYGQGNNVCLGIGGLAIINGEIVHGENDIVSWCSKDLGENTVMDYFYCNFPFLRQNNEYNDNPSSEDMFDIFQDPNREYIESLSVIKNLPLH